jgi:hypothetical protein
MSEYTAKILELARKYLDKDSDLEVIEAVEKAIQEIRKQEIEKYEK